ncbi:hypothetical protein FQN55_008046 [Onygenales sp. PD_40]|nr:hypothetical protein FQN55_008046 [Onygenales sp. PD_40]KAK2774031.1 hypothetical protein FQN52_004430 [Onygenales sp. PD_12]KAK2790269.1 hypothetical protein FQN53_000035 [Emmonsiellopsis sp. PD_33]
MEMEPAHHQPQHLRRASPPPGPFGYPLYGLDIPYEAPPALPSGPSLLDDTESNMLNNFFTSMDASHFDNNDFIFSLGDQDKRGGPAFGFEWPEELPPTFEGSTTSLGPYPNGIHQEEMNAGKASSLSSDVLAAASMLYQKNGLPAQDYVTDQMFTENSHNPSGNPPRSKSMHQGPPSDILPPGLSPKNLALFGKGLHTTKMYFDIEEHLGPEEQSRIHTLRWGSDSGFSHRRYLAPADQPSEEDRTQDLLQNLDCLESQSSAANTRPSSPVRRPLDRHASDWAAFGNKSMPAREPTQADDGSRPKKRRKSKNRIKDEDMDIDPPNKDSNGRQSSRGRRFSSSADPPQRKSKGQSTSKTARENLTEEQKRTNHILSEQKRRNLIKQGFDDLCSLVPELHGGGFSKSTMLIQAAEWLEDLLRGNEMLQAQLATLKTQSMIPMTQ